MREVMDWLIFCLQVIALFLLVLFQDYLLWNLYLLKKGASFIPFFDKFIRKDSSRNSSNKTNNQTTKERMGFKEFCGDTNNRENSNNNQDPENCYYPFTSGFVHIPYILDAYRQAIIRRINKGVNKKRGEPRLNLLPFRRGRRMNFIFSLF